MVQYRWQKECVSWLGNNGRGVAEVITRAGKTKMAIMAIEAICQKQSKTPKIFIIVPRVALATQWKEALRKEGYNPHEISIAGGGYRKTTDVSIRIGVINTARYIFPLEILRENQKGNDVFLIADEYHRYTSKENVHLFDFLKSPDSDPTRYSLL